MHLSKAKGSSDRSSGRGAHDVDPLAGQIGVQYTPGHLPSAKWEALPQAWSAIIGPVAAALLGEPNGRLSRREKVRYGRKGSLDVDLRRGVWFDFENDAGGGVLDLISHVRGKSRREAIRWLQSERLIDDDTPRRPATKPPPRADEHQQHRTAAWLWSRRQPISGTVAEKYLRTRGYHGRLPPTLAFLPPQKPQHHPALISAFAIPPEIEPGVLGEPTRVDAVHLTLLAPDGSDKAAERNKLFVRSPRGQPIVLAPPNDLFGLAIAEGIEDGLSVLASTGLGVWVAGSGSMMPALADVVPDYVESVTIFAHSDGGARHAFNLAAELDAREVEVFIEGAAS